MFCRLFALNPELFAMLDRVAIAQAERERLSMGVKRVICLSRELVLLCSLLLLEEGWCAFGILALPTPCHFEYFAFDSIVSLLPEVWRV